MYFDCYRLLTTLTKTLLRLLIVVYLLYSILTDLQLYVKEFFAGVVS